MIRLVTKGYKRLIREYARAIAFKWINEHCEMVEISRREGYDPPHLPERVTYEEIVALEKKLGLREKE